MRITGWILLIAGALLCATWAWATIGFLLMGIGLLSLSVAENSRKRAGDPPAPLPTDPAATADPPERVEPAMAPPIPETVAAVQERAPPPIDQGPRSYDREAWQTLVESDPDVARVAAVLADYGQSHVDQLAKACLADPDKTRLPEIVGRIIARAGRSTPRGRDRLLAPRATATADARPSDPDIPHEAVFVEPALQPGPLPQIKPDFSANTFVFLPVEASATAEAAAPAPPPPEPTADDRGKTIVSADDELSAMLGRLAPDADMLKK